MKKSFDLRSATGVTTRGAFALWLLLAIGVQAETWNALFDGKSLDGWIQRGGKAEYAVVDGTIVGTTIPIKTPNSFLCTERLYSDFVLELEFYPDAGINSGIQIRSNSLDDYKNGVVHGYQVEIDTSERAWTGGIYDESRRGWLFSLKDNPDARKAFKPETWNQFRIEAVGDRFRTWLNGVPAADLTDGLTSSGFIALQVHGSRIAGNKVRWRNIRIQDLAAGSAIDARLSAAIIDYDFEKSRKALAEIEALVRKTGPDGYEPIEDALLRALEDSRTSFAGKQWICRMLRVIGSADSVPALSNMLLDDRLSSAARLALQHMPAPEAGEALRDALTRAAGNLRIGLIGSLAQRGDRQAVSAIAAFVPSPNDDALTRASLLALGQIGGARSMKTLANVDLPAKWTTVRDEARLVCADKFLNTGRPRAKRRALAIYRDLTDGGHSVPVRIAAYRGLVRADEGAAVAMVITLLREVDPDLQQAAAGLIANMPGENATRRLAEQMNGLSAGGQVLLINALEGRGDKTAASYVAAAAGQGGDPSVRLAAIRALAVLGNAETVPLLAKATAEDKALGEAALQSLSRISGPQVAEALVSVVRGDNDAGVRSNSIQAIVNRGEIGLVPVLLETLKDGNQNVRRSSARALGALANGVEVPKMIAALAASKNVADRNDLAQSISAIASRGHTIPSKPVVDALENADDAVSLQLISILPHVADGAALGAARRQLNRTDPAAEGSRRAAIRALAAWPDPWPLSDLMRIAGQDSDSANRVLAVRGCLNLIALPANRTAAGSVELLSKVFSTAERLGEKKSVLASLTRFPCDEGLTLAQAAAAVSALAAESAAAVKSIRESLVNARLSVKASINDGDSGNAIDGDRSTRWATGRGMQPGDSFTVDLGSEQTVAGVTLDAAGSAGDYPRGYEVYVSFDGGQWGKPVTTGGSDNPITAIQFPGPVRARYLKIVQTGSVPNLFWSIHELKVDIREP